jgi:Fungal chitosanase of glycosyl hydrolase group 75
MPGPRPGHVEVIATVAGVRVRRRTGEKALFFVAGMQIDADGAPRAYHPQGSPPGLDFLANAGHPGNFFGVVTDRHGNPVVQSAHDPAPGFFVSPTSLQRPDLGVENPRRYVDASAIPYIVLPALVRDKGGVRLGDFATVRRRSNGKVSHAIFADGGPAAKIGEGSIALAKALGVPSSPKHGGTNEKEIVYVVFAGSGNGRPRTKAEIDAKAKTLLEAWGGLERLRKL